MSHKENSNNSTREFYQTLKKQIILILHKLFQKKEEKYIYLLNYSSILLIIRNKNPTLTIFKLSPIMEKRDRPGLTLYLEHKAGLNIRKSINVFHHVNRLQKKNI